MRAAEARGCRRRVRRAVRNIHIIIINCFVSLLSIFVHDHHPAPVSP